MSTRELSLSPVRTNLALGALFLGMFVLGSAELLVVGVLDLIADDLHVSIPAAGTLVTAYALGLALGGPLLTALTIRLNKRTVLLGALGLFVVSNLVAVLTTSYGVFLTARIVTGALQGLFIGAAFGAGIAVVPPERMGRAISVVVSGVAISAALGVPLGALVGQTLGWRGSFTAIVGLSLVVLIATAALVPSVPSPAAGAGHQARHAFAPRVLAMLLVNLLVFAALFAALTYVVPFLETVTGISGAPLSAFLLAYGVATAVGSFAGGRYADKNAGRTVVLGSVGLAAALLALYLVGSSAIPTALALVALGLFGMGIVPSLQYRVISLAGPGGQLAQALPASAANIGIALGSAAGGVAVGNLTVSAAVMTGAIVALITIPVAWGTGFLEAPVVSAALADR
ncbi:MFS transporter [Kribbella sp. CA-253562]|uniref:MFS transporter n=1 Tax=Kribbella sp. CA-253562 TaxID=3239942 RepID=UPI003D904981